MAARRVSVAVALTFFAAILVGCQPPGASPTAPASPNPTPATSQPGATGQGPGSLAPTAREPDTAAAWNDRAFALIHTQQWTEAAAAAQHAIHLDEKNAAAWFNLGRAQLGAGQATAAVDSLARSSELRSQPNADVSYYLGQAFTAVRRYVSAANTYRRALDMWPHDQAIAQAVQDLQAQHDLRELEGPDVDFDGEGHMDHVRVEQGRITIVSDGGRVLHDEAPWSNVPSAGQPRVQIYPLRGSTPLVHVTWPGCPQGLNRFLWYDHAASKVRGDDVLGICGFYKYEGDGRFAAGWRDGQYVDITWVHWDHGKFVTESHERRLIEK